MIETDAADYAPCIYDKATMLSPGKVGKTCWITAAALGVLPNQLKNGTGAIVGKPENLHIICIDNSAFSDVLGFLIKCGAPKEIRRVRIYNMQDDVNTLAAGEEEYDLGFYNAMLITNQKIRAKVAAGGTHAVIMSSLTGLATAIERGVAGPPGSAGRKGRDGEISGKGYMDPSKWQAHAQQMQQIRSKFQVDEFHMLWEGHIDVAKKFSMGQDSDGGVKESVAISGKTGRNWGWNTDHTYRLRRQFGDPWEGTDCDKVHMDTNPDMEFFPGGRGQDKLRKKEYDLSIVYKKLGLKRGGWGRKKESKVREG